MSGVIKILSVGVKGTNQPAWGRLDVGSKILRGDQENLKVSAQIASDYKQLLMRVEIQKTSRTSGPAIPLGIVKEEIVSFDPNYPIVSLTFDPIPSQIQCRPTAIPFGNDPYPDYVAIVTLSSASAPEDSIRPIEVEARFLFSRDAAPFVVGKFKVDSIFVSDDFEASPGTLQFDDSWEETFICAEISYREMNLPKDTQIRVTASIYDAHNKQFVASFPVKTLSVPDDFSSVKYEASIPSCDPARVDAKLEVFLDVRALNYINSISFPLEFTAGVRPDRPVQVTQVLVQQGASSPNTDFDTSKSGSFRVIVHSNAYGLDIGTRVRFAFSLWNNALSLSSPIPTRIVSFSEATIEANSKELVSTFEFQEVTDDLKTALHLIPVVNVTHSWRGINFKHSWTCLEWKLSPQRVAMFSRILSENNLDSGLTINVIEPSVADNHPVVDPSRLSGTQWYDRFPDKTSIDSLIEPFKSNFTAFIQMLRSNGVKETLGSCLRPYERAYLMHYAFKIANGMNPADVPSMNGVDIVWVHSTLEASRSAAAAMVQKYQIVFEPALNSKHCRGLAVDMNIVHVPETLNFLHNGQQIIESVGPPATGNDNQKLWAVAKKYFNIKKLPKDRPHWESV